MSRKKIELLEYTHRVFSEAVAAIAKKGMDMNIPGEDLVQVMIAATHALYMATKMAGKMVEDDDDDDDDDDIPNFGGHDFGPKRSPYNRN